MPRNGFSLVELLVAIALVLLVTGGVLAVINPTQGGFATGLEAVDMEQRLRVVSDTLTRDLFMAGAGLDAGPLAGPLVQAFAPILPFRIGAIDEDPPGTFRSDTITLLYVPATHAQSTLTGAVGPGQTALRVAHHDGCPQGSALCGFTTGMTVLIFDESGYDTFTITSVSGTAGQLRVHRPGDLMVRTYGPGSQVAEAVQRTYFLKTDPAADVSQLMRYGGGTNAPAPVVDHVVSLAFEYFGDPQPPLLSKMVSAPEGPWTTYGPRPPDLSTAVPPFAPGENCVFHVSAATGTHEPRLAPLSAGGSLVPLTAAELSDGQVVCPHAGDARRYDADLLRIRAVELTVRIQSALAALRGPAGLLFTNAGTSQNAHRYLPDREISMLVSPRNLTMSR